MFPQNDGLKFPKLEQLNLESGRVYRNVDSGEELDFYPSITRVLGAKEKPQLEAWKERVGADEAARVSAYAMNRGTGLHKAAECYLGNLEMPDIWPHVAELWQWLRPWLDDHVSCVYAQEQDLLSQKLGVAGRTDLIADVRLDGETEGKFTVVDFKQANKPKEIEFVQDYFLQGTFYCCAVYEATGRMPERIVILISSPEGLWVFVTRPEKHFQALRARIFDFYSKYEKAGDVESMLEKA